MADVSEDTDRPFASRHHEKPARELDLPLYNKHEIVTLAALQLARSRTSASTSRKHPPLDSPSAVNYPKIISLFTDNLSSDLLERHVDVLNKLTLVYRHFQMPVEHLGPFAHVLRHVLGRIENGATTLSKPFRLLLTACSPNFSHLDDWDQVATELCLIIKSPCIHPETKREIIKVFAAITPSETNSAFILEILDCFRVTLNQVEDGAAKPILKLMLLWGDFPSIKEGMATTGFSTSLRRLLQISNDRVIKLLCIQLMNRVVDIEREDITNWVPLLHSINDSVALTNDLLLILASILKANPAYNMDLVQFVLDRTLCELNCQPLHQIEASPAPFIATPDNVGHELALECKQVGFQIIAMCFYDKAARNHVLNHRYLDFCLGYLSFSPQDGFDQGWHTKDLKLIHANCLAHMTFLFRQGDLHHEALNLCCDPMLLNYLLECIHHDNGVPSKPNKSEPSMGLLSRYLHLICALCTYGTDIQVKLGKLGLVRECAKLLCCSCSTATHGVRRLLCSAMSAMCDNECLENQLIVVQTNLVYHLVQWIPTKVSHPNQQELLRMAVLDALWSIVCGCRLNEESFLEAGGVFKILDLLQDPQVERRVMSLLLSLLLEMFENPKSHQHVVIWSSSRYASALNLLLDLWRNEDVQSSFDKVAEQDLEEKSANFCCKIFSILCHIGWETICNHINEQDQQLLILIERHLDLKIGIAWEEIARELNSEGIRPISPDQHVLSSVNAAMHYKRRLIGSMQQHVKQKYAESVSTYESKFMLNFINSHQISCTPRAHKLANICSNSNTSMAKQTSISLDNQHQKDKKSTVAFS